MGIDFIISFIDFLGASFRNPAFAIPQKSKPSRLAVDLMMKECFEAGVMRQRYKTKVSPLNS
ncbi:hypothetical protein SAMN06265367_10521 [Algoriphagus winogradskyi]|jgi:hypothetical protein|uniref:Uncharacterized protein n=1 Tax=Algoriphagus winogradskyi TaxID=237017 RepID=A0ABY1P7Z7_9BACT|nr:hypothetical protein SAMN06265367_10521 [Algoriphagus winogradskyi]